MRPHPCGHQLLWVESNSQGGESHLQEFGRAPQIVFSFNNLGQMK